MALDPGEVEELKQYIQHLGIERVLKVWYGIYRAFVIDDKDPQQRGRIRIACPSVGHNPTVGLEDTWVDPLFDNAGNNFGDFKPPTPGSLIRVFFSNGNPAQPIGYLGGWYTKSDGKFPLPTEFAYADDGSPQKRGFITRAGHMFLFNDEPGQESISLIWHQPDPSDPALSDKTKTADRTKGKFSFLTFDKSGSVQLANQNGSIFSQDATNKQVSWIDELGNSITTDKNGIKLIDKSGNLITLDSAKGNMNVVVSGDINLTGKSCNLKVGGVFLGDGAPLSAVLGEPLLAYLASHVHLTFVGPTTTPLVPPTPALLSQNVKLK